MKQRWILAALLGALVCCGCERAGSSAQTAPPTAAEPGEPTHAQPKLATMKIFIGTIEMNAEIAATLEQEHTGMMFRTNVLAENEGMLFPLPYTQRASFWMKNCPVSLSAAYIDNEGVIQEIHKLEANNTNAVLSASDNIRFVLETAEGWFDRHHVQPGVAIATERGPLYQTFFGRKP